MIFLARATLGEAIARSQAQKLVSQASDYMYIYIYSLHIYICIYRVYVYVCMDISVYLSIIGKIVNSRARVDKGMMDQIIGPNTARNTPHSFHGIYLVLLLFGILLLFFYCMVVGDQTIQDSLELIWA